MYSLLRKIAFMQDAETAHHRARRVLERLQGNAPGRAALRTMAGSIPSSPVNVMGLRFRHPLGLAAGFDKDAQMLPALQELGFAFVEVGTVTPQPQAGNPRPRIWRFPEAEALVNALGFPGHGMAVIGARLRKLRERGRVTIPVGINFGKNAATTAEDAPADYLAVLEHLFDLGDFFVVNVSSPNTAGLRDLQAVERLRPLLGQLLDAAAKRGAKPLLLKIAPDLSDDDVCAVGRLVKELGLAGIVAGNTTINRSLVSRAAGLDRGGLSGAPQFPRTRALLALLRAELAAEQALIAAGGISTAGRLRDCRAAGAALVQVYTPFIYRGPRCVRTLLEAA